MAKIDYVLICSSDDVYGSDRILEQVAGVIASLPAATLEVWVPDDLPPVDGARITGLRRRGIAVSRRKLPILRRAKMRVRALPRLVLEMLKTAFVLLRLRPRVVYLGTSACLLLAPIARAVGAKPILHVQEIWNGRAVGVLEMLARPCAELICISAPVFDSLPPSLKLKSKIVVNALPSHCSSDVKRDWSVQGPGSTMNFLIASRWNSWKGHDLLLEAWSSLSSGYHLTILGGPPDSGEIFDVRRAVERMPNRESVTVVGQVPDIKDYIRAADVLIVPSSQPEPFGLVAIEAISMGVPVIASDRGGVAEVILDSNAGWLFEIGSSKSLLATIQALTYDDVERASEEGASAVREKYGPERFQQEIRAIVEQVGVANG